MQRDVVMFVYEGVNLIDVGGPLQAFEAANRTVLDKSALPYRLIVVSSRGGAVATGPGLPVMTQAFDTLDAGEIDTILVPGGSSSGSPVTSPDLTAWLAGNAARIRRVCSVCTGAFTLAAAGLLDGKRVTTHWNWAELLAKTNPAIAVDADPIFIRDGAIWTSAGVTAGIDLALALIEEDLGHRTAITVARSLVVFMKRPGGQAQFSAPLVAQSRDGGAFEGLHGWMAANLASDLRVEQLAEQAGMSPRNFARLYQARMGCTPAKMVERMRLEAACRALEETDRPAKCIAADVGYGEEQNLRRVFLRRFGVAPGQYRDRFSRYRGNIAEAHGRYCL